MDAACLYQRIEDAKQPIDFDGQGCVTVYRFLAMPAAAEIDALALQWLSDDEQAHSLKFVFPRDQVRYRWRRILARGLLAKYIACDPTQVTYQTNPWGKPSLVTGDASATPIYWNLSDSENSVVIAVSHDVEVGIDIERHRSLRDFDALARSIMHPEELSRWTALSDHQRTQWFFDLWSTKEALIKCCGYGLSLAPKKLNINPEIPADCSQFVAAVGPDQRQWNCQVKLARDITDFSFAVAVASPGTTP